MNSFVIARLFCLLMLISCSAKEEFSKPGSYIDTQVMDKPEEVSGRHFQDTPVIKIVSGDRNAIVTFAESLQGVPYKYGATHPADGFDCSGFITYVFNHFNIQVPRSSIDFTNVGKEVPLAEAKRGDLILFTGTDSTIRIVGHMGIVTENNDTLKFIHSTSGKAFSVTITPISNYYMGRFVKVIDIF